MSGCQAERETEQERERCSSSRESEEKVWEKLRVNMFAPTNDAVLFHSHWPVTARLHWWSAPIPQVYSIWLVLSEILLATYGWTSKHCTELISTSRKKHNSPVFPQNWISGILGTTSDKHASNPADGRRQTWSSLHFIVGTKMCKILNSLYRDGVDALEPERVNTVITLYGLGV